MSLPNQIQNELGDTVERIDAPLPTFAPRDEAAARALVAFCGRERLAFVAQGHATKSHIGAPPTRLDLTISTRHLAQIFDHDAGNATLEAGAGLSLAALNSAVADARQFVPLDDDGGTLGGAVACNSFGPSRLKWGAPRDLVVGLEAALSDGRHIKGGAKVVKNVAGYDLPKLFVGSFGSLGLITRVTIRLRPNDAASQEWSEAFESLDELQERAEMILNGPFEPTLLRASWRGESWVLRARFDGGELAVAGQLQLLPASSLIEDAPVWDAPWQLRAQLPLARAYDWLRAAGKRGADAMDWQPGLGVARVALADCADEVESLRELAHELGGWLRVDAAPLDAKTPELVWGKPGGEVALMRALKASYDAANVCAPGRLVDAI